MVAIAARAKIHSVSEDKLKIQENKQGSVYTAVALAMDPRFSNKALGLVGKYVPAVNNNDVVQQHIKHGKYALGITGLVGTVGKIQRCVKLAKEISKDTAVEVAGAFASAAVATQRALKFVGEQVDAVQLPEMVASAMNKATPFLQAIDKGANVHKLYSNFNKTVFKGLFSTNKVEAGKEVTRIASIVLPLFGAIAAVMKASHAKGAEITSRSFVKLTLEVIAGISVLAFLVDSVFKLEDARKLEAKASGDWVPAPQTPAQSTGGEGEGRTASNGVEE